MKKTVLILVVLSLLFTAIACADEASAMTDPFSFPTFGDVTASLVEGDAYSVSDGYAVAMFSRDGRLFRAVASFDEHAEELYAAYRDLPVPEGDAYPGDEFLALCDYVRTLPVQYTEELTAKPFTQEELDAMVGKTIGEIMSEPWELQMQNYPKNAEAGKDIVFPMVKGFYEYGLVISESFDVYQERRAGDRYDPVTIMSLKNYLDLTVKCVYYTRLSHNAMDLRYQADGTFISDNDPIPEDYDYDLMVEIADYLASVWENGEPDQETKEAMITELTEKHPEAAEMVRQIVNSFH